MAASVFYADLTGAVVGAPIVVSGAEAHHAVTVRRTGAGSRVALTDGTGRFALGQVVAVAPGRAPEFTVDVAELIDIAPPTPPVTVVQALIKADRADAAIASATEAGVDVLVPWAASRSIAKWVGPKQGKAHAKWESVALEASKQSRRARFPEVTPLASTARVAELIRAELAAGGTALVLHESAEQRLSVADLERASSVLLVVGPEGGIAPDELATFAAAGARAVLLGPNVLRAATAATVALGAIGIATQRWNDPPIGEQ